ncbi:nucleotidyltransferase family protein [Aquiflexum lacus]|uniref:nucleotidyltransferase family protein n=1 Tax=Aquiflexum lacus TaxID=2483805 RepID=UPI001893BA2D|nr:nucleotidyltransferase domain-containing protein [Aquiflexum lacus]
MIKLIQNKLDEIIAACKQHHVEAISLFGSAAKNAMHEDSDIDLLVEFSDDIDVLEYADNYFSLLEQLEDILSRKVDLVSSKSLKNSVLKEDVYQSKIDLYAA